MGATLWQKQKDGSLKPFRIVRRFLPEKVFHKRTGVAGGSLGTGTFPPLHIRKT